MSTHTPSCLEPLSTKIVERWSLNCWLIPRLCLNWTLTGREGQTVLIAELMPRGEPVLSLHQPELPQLRYKL